MATPQRTYTNRARREVESLAWDEVLYDPQADAEREIAWLRRALVSWRRAALLLGGACLMYFGIILLAR
ncbi:MAG: hypothetical protein ACJ741_11100 [Pyrinomonadaceae bacterium]